MLVESNGECAGVWWMSGGHAGPLLLGVQSGEWEAAASRTVDAPHLVVQKHPHW